MNTFQDDVYEKNSEAYDEAVSRYLGRENAAEIPSRERWVYFQGVLLLFMRTCRAFISITNKRTAVNTATRK